MSRFVHDLADGGHIAYGLDNGVGYFACHYDPNDGLVEEVFGRSGVLSLFEKHKIENDVNQWHITSIVMDLPLASSEEGFKEEQRKCMANFRVVLADQEVK